MPDQNKIQNPETSVSKTTQMNDRDFLNDMLSTEKYFNSSYSIALNEASHSGLYNELLNISTETKDMQRTLYNLMFEMGWYSLEKAEPQKISQSYQQFTGYKNQLPYSQQELQ
ncbi:spore coat protein [Peribacillus sp. B-H-3]|jgi:spore coat protein CotF|uniref:spore coat protein n=1 Tax=Peribacillus sp. B-H-3 TaxID=3400420 RepID=UPI003B0280F3